MALRITSPESCALEFYVRSGRDSRFQRLGPAFLHSPAAIPFLDVQVVFSAMFSWIIAFLSWDLVIVGAVLILSLYSIQSSNFTCLFVSLLFLVT